MTERPVTEPVQPAQVVIGGVSSTPPQRRTLPNAAECAPDRPPSDGSGDGGSRPQEAAEPPERPAGGRQVSGRDPSGEEDSAGSRAPPRAAEGERRTGLPLLGGGFGEVPASPFPWTGRERCSLRHRPYERTQVRRTSGFLGGPCVRGGARPTAPPLHGPRRRPCATPALHGAIRPGGGRGVRSPSRGLSPTGAMPSEPGRSTPGRFSHRRPSACTMAMRWWPVPQPGLRLQEAEPRRVSHAG